MADPTGQPFFHGDLPRSAAATLLQGQANNTFLVRNSLSVPGAYVVDVVARGGHLPIKVTVDTASSRLVLPSLPEFGVEGGEYPSWTELLHAHLAWLHCYIPAGAGPPVPATDACSGSEAATPVAVVGAAATAAASDPEQVSVLNPAPVRRGVHGAASAGGGVGDGREGIETATVLMSRPGVGGGPPAAPREGIETATVLMASGGGGSAAAAPAPDV